MYQPLPQEASSSRGQFARMLAGLLLFLVFAQAFAAMALGKNITFADYRSFYAAGVMLRTEPAAMYDMQRQEAVQATTVGPRAYALPFYHLPYEELVYAPFSYLPYATSYRVFMVFNAVLLALVILLLPSLSPRSMPLLQRYPGVALFAFAPVTITLLQGQDSLLCLLLLCVSWQLLRKDADLATGIVLGFALFRFQLVLPVIALLFLYRRSLRMAAGVLAGGGTAAALCVWLVGVQGMRGYIGLLRGGSLSHGGDRLLQIRMAIHPLAMPNLFGLVHALAGRHLHPMLVTAAVLACSLALLCRTGWHLYRRERDTRRAFALALLCAILISYHMYVHDASLLVLALALLRTRAALYVGYATYALALLVVYCGLDQWFFLLAVPPLLLLLYTTQPRHAMEQKVTQGRSGPASHMRAATTAL